MYDDDDDDAFSLSSSIFRRTHSKSAGDEWDALLIAIVPKFESFVVYARQSDSRVVDLLAVHYVRLQFFVGTEVVQTSEKRKKL